MLARSRGEDVVVCSVFRDPWVAGIARGSFAPTSMNWPTLRWCVPARTCLSLRTWRCSSPGSTPGRFQPGWRVRHGGATFFV